MIKNNKHKKLKYILVLLCIAIVGIPGTKATLFEDSESIENNSFTAQSLDLELDSEEDEFSPLDSLYPGNKTSNTYTVKNSGTLPFYYGLKIDPDENNSSSCSEINIKVRHESEILFDDPILDFHIQFDESDEFFDHMELDNSEEHPYNVEIYVPIYADENLSDKSCTFKLVAFSWQKQYQPYEGYFDDEEDKFTINTANWTEQDECMIGQVFLIGDKENEKSDNPVDELNWPGAFGSFPDFANPFSVGLTPDNEFPWNSNYDSDYAKNVEVEFFYPSSATIAKLTLSWSPGKSGDEQKEVFLDGESIGTTNKYIGTKIDGWWEDMERFEDEFTFELSPGPHTLKFTQLEGDGTLWDYVELEVIECEGLDESEESIGNSTENTEEPSIEENSTDEGGTDAV